MSLSNNSASVLNEGGAARAPKRLLDFAQSGPYFAALLLVALVAFWPSYLSLGFGASSAYIHLHATTATLWILMLIAQPTLIRARRMDIHRILGRFSQGLAAVVLMSVVFLAHSRIKGLEGEAYGRQTYILYLQASIAFLFSLSYVMALVTRRSAALHARFMVCTGMTLLDPIVIRLMFWANPTPTWNYQWFTFGLTDSVFLALIFLERDRPTGRQVFPAILGVFMLMQVPALFGLTNTPLWQAFARWFAALPLT
ncbi:MAG: hypothetical protein EXQ56_14220 [Acidobacteria bacterium]|nr:hypothetical protein [Acidobacteriota bacterium]